MEVGYIYLLCLVDLNYLKFKFGVIFIPKTQSIDTLHKNISSNQETNR